MKISLLRDTAKYPENSLSINELIKTGKNQNIEINVLNSSPKELGASVQEWGEVMIWRSGSYSDEAERQKVIEMLSDAKIPLINSESLLEPRLADKLYQYDLVRKGSNILTIPTFSFQSKEDLLEAIKERKISLPIIQKPRVGAQGVGVVLLREVSDISIQEEDFSSLIFQPFIKNTGDFRIFMIGGVAVGMMKRVPKTGEYRNNISQGGSAQRVSSNELQEQLLTIAEKIANLCKLHVFGLDVLLSEEDNCLYFLEINTVPEWQGLQQATGAPVPQEIITLACHIHEKKGLSTVAAVDAYYRHYAPSLPFETQFHFYGRLWLWSNDAESRNWLIAHKEKYLGAPGKQNMEKVNSRLSSSNKSSRIAKKYNGIRIPILERYPYLLAYVKTLFFTLHAKNIYGVTITPTFLPTTLESYQQTLSESPRDVAILSTIGVNFLYLSQWYLGQAEDTRLPEYIYGIAKEQYNTKNSDEVQLQLYLLTHSIIGATKFYRWPIQEKHKNIYRDMIVFAEGIIQENYEQLPIDIKFEFLVCAKLCGYTSTIQARIHEESTFSFSPIGNFLINRSYAPARQQGFKGSEHSNVLFIMGESLYNPPKEPI